MEDGFRLDLPDMQLFGCAYFRLLANSFGEAEDYVFLSVNPAFERMTGLCSQDTVGKRASEVFNCAVSGGCDWLSFYAGAVHSGMSQEIIQWFERCRQYYKVTVIPQDRETFVTIVQSIPDGWRGSDIVSLTKESNSIFENPKTVFGSSYDAMQPISNGVVTTDNYGIITGLRGITRELTGWTDEEAMGKPFTEVFRLYNEETREPVESPIQKVLETGHNLGMANHTVLVNRHGRSVSIAASAAPIHIQDGKIFGVTVVYRDVSREKEQSDQIRYLSYHDSLTGLYNRRYIESILDRLDIPENLPISVIVGDINGLKTVNDVFGHESGDVLLQHVSQMLQLNCRKGGLTARWGGDEFIILIPRTDQAAAEEILHRIRSDSEAANGDTLRGVSLSLGCAVKARSEDELRGILRKAEEYMYQQKLLDGNSYRKSIINTLLGTLFERSMETKEHAERLEMYCRSMGSRLGLSSREMDELSLLAVLHDIGKIGISRSILQKPARLTTVEWEEMKRHPEVGYRIAQTTPELAAIADLILSHHEHWDGQGYPRGLKGEDIPLVCRILTVADAFDAMTNDRAYRKAMSKSQAIEELKKNTGKQFDPTIVGLFLKTMPEVEGLKRSAQKNIFYPPVDPKSTPRNRRLI